MKYKFINLIFITYFIISSKTSNAERRAPKVQLAAKEGNLELGRIKSIILGSNDKINIAKLFNLLKENEKKEKQKLTLDNTEGKSAREEVKIAKKRPEDTKDKEVALKGADRSDESDEKPLMRNGETAAEVDLQYDFDDHFLRISLK